MRIGRWSILVAVAVAIATLAAGCAKQQSVAKNESKPAAAGPATAVKGTIEVLVPCGQVGPFSKIYKLFEEKHPGVTVDWVQENIVTMTRKVLDGKAKPDAFLSMADLEMNQLEKAGMLEPGTRRKVAENSLAIVVPVADPGGVNGIEDFVKPSVKSIAIPNPKETGVGLHTQDALEKLGIWDKVKDKVVLPQFAADSKDLAAAGKVEAAVAYYPCSVEVHVKDAPPGLPKSLKLVGHIPSNLYQEFWCEGAVIKGAKNPEGGKMLLDFLRTPEVQEIYRQWEFVREPKASAAGK
jgi:molybdate transport system substrate-binding protein